MLVQLYQEGITNEPKMLKRKSIKETGNFLTATLIIETEFREL